MKPKSHASLVIAAMPDDEKGKKEDADESDGDELKMAAAEEVMAALKSGDASAFAEAMTDFLECCGKY